MNKSKIIIALCCPILLLSGCGTTSESYNILPGQESVVSCLEDDIMEIDYKKTTTLRVTSPTDNMYRETLNIEVANKYVDAFIRCADSVETYEEPFESEPWYSIQIMSSEGIIDKWRVDCSGVISTSKGVKIRRAGDLDDLLNQIESDYSISMNILSSSPGNNYFGLIKEVKSIVLYKTTHEFTSDDSDENVNSDVATSIKAMLSQCEIISSQTKPDNVMYSLVLYGQTEEPLYKLLIDADGDIYTSYGYPIKSPDLESLLNSLIQ